MLGNPPILVGVDQRVLGSLARPGLAHHPLDQTPWSIFVGSPASINDTKPEAPQLSIARARDLVAWNREEIGQSGAKLSKKPSHM